MTESGERPKGDSLRPLAMLVPFLRPYRGWIIAALMALLVASSALLALPVALRFLIDNGFAANDLQTVNRYFGWFFLAAVLFGGFASLRFYLVTRIGERVVADLRSAVFARVIRMDPTFFEVTRTGEVLSRITTDTTLVQNIAGVSLSIALRSALNLVGGLIMLTLTSFQLTLYIVLGVPLVVLPMIWIGRRVRKLSRTAQDRVADTSGVAGESLEAIQTVQAYTLESLQTEHFDEAVEDSFSAAMSRIRTRAAMTAVAIVMIFGAITFILWMGSRAVIGGSMTGGQLAQFLAYSMFVGASAGALSELWGEIQRGAGAMERIAELLKARPAIEPPTNPEPLHDRAEGRIRFDQVNFNYPSRPETLALGDLSFHVAPGETVAIVGPSGAGKSTCFQLLLRFYDPQSGEVCVDGHDLRKLDPVDLRGQIALVPQDTVLFGESARENIRLGRPGATDAEVEAAAIAAAAHDFIKNLPEGYDSFLGERGIRLSGGQRQRIAIARAILKDPPILLLDEATSALDSESERLVQAALEALMVDRTTMIIAHRLSTVKKADRILVLDQGRLVAQGTHDELLAGTPLYARLAALQFGNLEEGQVPAPAGNELQQ